jgi:hypothetical protein
VLSSSGPIAIDCDAPPYAIVRACAKLGFRSPLDVRWRRVKAAREQAGWKKVLSWAPWKLLRGAARPRRENCSCGAPRPHLETCVFIGYGFRARYVIGQCDRCRTIFWDEAAPDLWPELGG